MEKVKKDFMRKECRRLTLCAAGLAMGAIVLSWRYPERASFRPLLFLGVLAVAGLAALRSAVQAHAQISALTENDVYFIEREYGEPHPIYKVWQGEIHLMQSFIVCRSRGRLLFIPIHNIERVERRFDHTGVGKIPFAKFVMDTGPSISVGFSVSRSKESEAVFAWLIDRLGEEKVTR